MQLAVSTSSLAYSTPEALTRAADLGYKTVEINLDSEEFGYGYRRRPNVRLYREIKKQLEELGLSVWSITLPELTHVQMFSERARKDLMMNAAGAGGILGAKVFVVEPNHIYTTEEAFEGYIRENLSPPVVTGYDETWAQVVNRRMSMALLNTDYYMGSVLTNQVGRIEKTTRDLGIGWALDVRRAIHRNKLTNWFEAVGERLAVAYAYDLAEDNETQLTPATEDWPALVEQLSATRLKYTVVRGHPDQEDGEFVTARGLLTKEPA